MGYLANCPPNVPVKTFQNWSIFGEDIDDDKVGSFFGGGGVQCNIQSDEATLFYGL